MKLENFLSSSTVFRPHSPENTRMDGELCTPMQTHTGFRNTITNAVEDLCEHLPKYTFLPLHSPPPQEIIVCVLSRFSRVQLFVTVRTGAQQAPLSMEILQARILEWVATPSSRGPPPPRDRTLSLVSLALAGRFFTTSPTWKAYLPSQISFTFLLQMHVI